MFIKKPDAPSRTILEGITLTPLAYGDKTNLGEFHLKKGFTIPSHSHPFEQTGYLISGKLNFRIDDIRYEAEPGDSWCIPFDVKHEVNIKEDSVVIEVFSPVRYNYL